MMTTSQNYSTVMTTFPQRAQVVTPDDDVTFSEPNVIYVGTAGTVVVEPVVGGNTVSFVVLAGAAVPIQVRRVLAAGTTATNLVRVW